MPLWEEGGVVVLRCINPHDIIYEARPVGDPPRTTMMTEPGWQAFMRRNSAFSMSSPGLAVSASVCSVCGYVEMYAGRIVSPEEWPPAYGGAEALAQALGVHPSTVSRWAREVVPVSSPSKTAIRWAARAVGVRSPV